MKRCVSLAMLAGLFVWTSAALAQDAVTIKLKDAGKGETLQIEKTETATVLVKATDDKGQALLEKTEKKAEITAFKQTVLEGDPRKPTKLEREYTKAQVKVEDMTMDLPYGNKTVVIEKKGDKFTFTIKGGAELKAEDAQYLDKEFNSGDKDSDLEKLLLPKGPVNLNQEWKVDMEPVLKELMKGGEIDVDKAKATGVGKLLKVYQKDGKQYGEIQIKLTMPLTSITPGKGAPPLKGAEGAKAIMDFTLDTCIDGTEEAGSMKGKMKLTLSAPLPQPEGASLSLDITSDVQETRKELPKK